MELLCMEWKRIIKSWFFWVVMVLFIFSVHSQLAEEDFFSRPKPGEDSYGTMRTDDFEIIYQNAMFELLQSYQNNGYTTYPMAFYRHRKLNTEEQDIMSQIIMQLTGFSKDTIQQMAPQDIFQGGYILPEKEMLFALFYKVDALLGGGYFDKNTWMDKYGRIEKTYAMALEEYENILSRGFTKDFARIFCDYAGVFAGLLAGFMPVFLWYKDRKRRVTDIIYVKNVSDVSLFCARTMAYLLAFIGVVFLFVTFYQWKAIHAFGWKAIDTYSLYWMALYWLLPTVFVITALSSLITIATDSPLAIPVIVLTWFLSVRGSLYKYGWKLIPRHNEFGNEVFFLEHYKQLILNRLLWTGVGIFLSLIAIYVLKQKREGKYVTKIKLHR
ncbi:MAG: hypothetical protein Q4Q17_00585 [Tissierellia bacterium]|nr:hypothetical protein [Tissierellia bacterium]